MHPLGVIPTRDDWLVIDQDVTPDHRLVLGEHETVSPLRAEVSCYPIFLVVIASGISVPRRGAEGDIVVASDCSEGINSPLNWSEVSVKARFIHDAPYIRGLSGSKSFVEIERGSPFSSRNVPSTRTQSVEASVKSLIPICNH